MCDVDRPVTTQEIIDGIKDEYAGERQMTYKRVDDYIQQLLGVNMIAQDKVEFDDNDELVVYYKVSDFGKSRIKYIPKRRNR